MKNHRDLAYVVDHQTVAVVISLPLKDDDIMPFIDAFKNKNPFKHITVIVKVPDHTSETRVRNLYRAGVDDVFRSIDTSHKCSKLILEHNYNHQKGMGLTKQDKRISKAISARVRVFANGTKQVKFYVRNGKAYLLGKLKSFKRKRKLERIALATPGVSDVVGKGVKVTISPQSDLEIVNLAYQKMIEEPSIVEQSIGITVKEGILTLRGAVPTAREYHHIEKVLSSLNGIKQIHNRLTVSKELYKSNCAQASKAQHILRQFFIHSDLRVAICKNIAFVTGIVDLPGKMNIIERVISENMPGIKKISNQVQVA